MTKTILFLLIALSNLGVSVEQLQNLLNDGIKNCN